MIYLITPKPGPRLDYIADILFGRVMQTAYRVIASPDQAESPGALIYYSEEAVPGQFCIPRSGLLDEVDISVKEIKIITAEVPILHFKGDRSGEGFSVPFDILSAAFYLITEYYYYTEKEYDIHGRHQESADPTSQYDLHALPVIHIYAEYLWEKLIQQYPSLTRKQGRFSFLFTFDVDAPYLFKYRPLWLQAAGLVKDVLKGEWDAIRKRLSVYLGQQDPYDTYQYIQSQLAPEEAVFFFLLNRRSEHDDRYTYIHSPYRELIKKLSGAGYPIGIHPSYTSFLNPELIAFEKAKLEDITGSDIRLARMHFLKYRLPHTYRHLLAAGIRHDYTSCMIHNAGYRHFIAIPFPWFDLEANTATPLILHPAMAMDRSLESYAGLKPAEALERIRYFIALTAKYQGCFIMLMHNSTLSEYREWQGWRGVFNESLKLLRQEKEKS